MKLLWAAALALICSALSLAPSPGDAATPAPKPLYRDPVYDGAADVSLVYDRGEHRWLMFYTNRRATLRLPDPEDVAWVHGTHIGIATSTDGLRWTYAGVANIPFDCTGATLWAPELYYERGTYHMWLTVVPTIDHRWSGDNEASIVHLTSSDLKRWSCSDTVATGSQRVIDASVMRLGKGRYRLWYKDERAGSRIFALDSADLVHWKKVLPDPVTNTSAEGPKVFRFKGWYWLIADAWKGLIVLRSKDAARWIEQPMRILETPGFNRTDTAKGQHPDVLVNDGHAFIYYFVHQGDEPEAKRDPYWHQRTVIQVARLKYANGWLSVDRNETVRMPLKAP
jgi:beta-xylosidase